MYVGVGGCGHVSLLSHYSYIALVPLSGLRGAIAYALALNLSERGETFGSAELIRVLDTTTLIVVLFTIICFGGSTLPLLKVGSSSTPSSIPVRYTSGSQYRCLYSTQGAALVPFL